MAPAPGQSAFATLLAGMAVRVDARKGRSLVVTTRGPVRITGVIPERSVGLCAGKQAPVRLKPGEDPVGHVPAGWCFRVLRETPDDVVMSDATFGLTFHIAHRYLTDRIEWRRRFNPIRAGFGKYRIQPQPMPRKRKQAPYFTVPQGEWRMRAVYEEGDFAQIEILGEVVILQGWERSTNLYKDLFRKRDDVELARKALAEKRRKNDRRAWFELRRKSPVRLSAGGKTVGEIDAGVRVTVNRRSGPWSQLRIEPNDRFGRPVHRMDARIWVRSELLTPSKSAFEE